MRSEVEGLAVDVACTASSLSVLVALTNTMWAELAAAACTETMADELDAAACAGTMAVAGLATATLIRTDEVAVMDVTAAATVVDAVAISVALTFAMTPRVAANKAVLLAVTDAVALDVVPVVVVPLVAFAPRPDPG